MLQTLIVEIEATLNDQPSTHVPCDIANSEPITPAHLLYGRRIICLPHSRGLGIMLENFGNNDGAKESRIIPEF